MNDASATPRELRYARVRELDDRLQQVRAALRAADRFLAVGLAEDTTTATWLVSCASAMAAELADDVTALARGLREAPAMATLAQTVQQLRARAHELHAATRAADHFLEGEHNDDRETGGWLIVCARGLADKLGAGLGDVAANLQQPAAASVVDAQEAALQRRLAQATAPAIAPAVTPARA